MELLDVYDETGEHRLGTKPRDAVHRDGDWHRAFHLWVVSARGVLFQRRAASKTAFPLMLDATAAGHLVAGEDVADGLREAEEELGVRWALADLHDLGVHRVDDRPAPGMVNREHQHVFAVRDDRPLGEYTGIARDEVAGLVLVGHDGAAALLAGGTARGVEWDGEARRTLTVRAAELVPAPYLPEIVPVLRDLVMV